MEVNVEVLRRLQRRQERIRNLSVLAHVDHGKTTLSDNLIASNGLIHPKLVGELRYLDSREDEQIRGITMKSSSISLVYLPKSTSPPITQDKIENFGFLVNLIDSPGHVDFCSEVSTAARLTDGCLIVVDAVEGVCIQTHAVLRQAWEEKVCPCLMVNKIDRLITSLGMDPSEAELQLKQIISQVNMIMSAFESEHFLSEANAVLAHEAAKEVAHHQLDQAEDDQFNPVKGNVVFGSAIDGWGFTIQQFAEMYAKKLGASVAALNKALWGEFQYQVKTKSVMKIKHRMKNQKTMFQQFVLEPIYNAYTALEPEADFQDILGRIIKGRGLDADPSRNLLTKDKKQSFKSVMSKWLPLADAALEMVTVHLPNPMVAADHRMAQLLSYQKTMCLKLPVEIQDHFNDLLTSLHCSNSSEEAPVVIYISKMIAVDPTWIPKSSSGVLDHKRRSKEDVFLAFGRVFSGVARPGLKVHVLSSGFDPSQPFTKHRQVCTLGDLYLMMGRGLEHLEEVPSGNVLAIEGLEEFIHKSATISSSPYCPPLVPMPFQCAAIVRVAIEPTLPSDLSKLEHGLRRLSKTDPFVEVEILPTGEHVIGAAGEVHLWTCLKDLKERYANIELEVSPPLVAFKETVWDSIEVNNRVVHTTTSSGVCEIRVRAFPLSGALAGFLTESNELLQNLFVKNLEMEVEDFRTRIGELVQDQTPEIQQLLKRAWMLGPRKIGPNLLLASNQDSNSLFEVPENQVVHLSKKSRLVRPGMPTTVKGELQTTVEQPSESEELKSDSTEQMISIPVQFGHPEAAECLGLIKKPSSSTNEKGGKLEWLGKKHYGEILSGLVAGFQLATTAGPLCEEPIWGVIFDAEIQIQCPPEKANTLSEDLFCEDIYGPITGQVMTAMKACCRQALMECSPRLVEALYLCEVSTSAEFLSGVYSVLSRRRGRILREELQEGSDLFIVHAYLPVEASFGFADELRSKSSGGASCSLLLSHWERLEVDPFFVPTTEEEREEFGDDANNLDSTNLAKKLIHAVRKRKGLVVHEKVVESATKQRTLAKKV